ncbi:MAG: pitrilysin family protein [bacterium]|nr:pitrilysin family protein [bacterium]
MPTSSSTFPIHHAKLPSGLRLLVLPMSGTNTVSFFLVARTGSRQETPELAGISHFLEHLFFKGSKNRPSTRQISEAIDGVGGEMNAFTSKEVTAFYAKASRRHAELIVDVISDMVLHPLLDPKEIDRERGVVIEEINMYEDTPMRSIGETFEETLYGQHAIAHPVIGTKENITRFSRETILRYLKRQYRAQSVVACLAGDVDPAEGFAMLRRALRALPEGRAPSPRPFRRNFGRDRLRLKEKATDQTHVVIGVPGISALHRDRPVIDLTSVILGGGMSSRLFLEVRERRGLAYAVRTSPDYFMDTGYVATQAGVGSEKLLDACRVILQEHAKLRKVRVSSTELNKAREFVKGRLLLALEASDEVAQFAVLQEVLLNRILTPDDIFRRLDAVGPSDVQRVARRAFADRQFRLVAIGPKLPERELSRVLDR